ncbi:hypothetical protein EJ03DRAFT_122743 [Teratosphaeria nubilosa]|uniref:Uncharacterized protein n=1 Tax=Teratosphaeria nubilosa TaxID=161662 RepID=A0A6G1L7L3_9PEZI|nr:hypothetical protein EJ03DRAFT_122743 [Teratosphaeria nubilosa]
MTPSDGPSHSPRLAFLYVTNPSKASRAQRRIVKSRATQHSHRSGTRKPKARKNDSQSSNRKSSVVTTCLRDDSNCSAALVAQTAVDRKVLALQAAGTTVYHGQNTRVRLEGGHTDPFSALPVPEQPWFHWVLDYHRHIRLPLGIAVVQRSPEEALEYIDWHLRESMTEPCFFYVQLSIACTPLLAEGLVKHEITIWLRGKVTSSLNEALSSADRMNSLATVLTLCSIALHERFYGDAKMAVQVHGAAFSRLLAMKGGFQNLRVPRLLFEMLLWTSHILAADSAQETPADLLAAWASASLRRRHPGYGLSSGAERF